MRIWLALLAAPILALADQSIAYATVGWACAHQHVIAVHVVHALFAVATAASMVAAWQLWRETEHAPLHDEVLARRHFLAGLGTASAALSTLVILAMWYPTWVIAPCLS